MKKAIFLMGFFSLLLAPYQPVFARQCFQPSAPKEELQKATAVFSGTVVDIGKKKVSVGQDFFEDSYTATFDVERAWKGVSKKTIIVNAGIQGGMCGYPFEEDESYIVYADGANENALSTSICTRTNKLIYAHEDLKELGEGQADLVLNTVPALPAQKFDFFYYGGFNFWYYFGIGMFVVGLIAIIFLAFLLLKHKQRIVVFLERRFLLIVAFAAGIFITAAAVYQITNLTLEQEQKQKLESMRSAFSEQIGDLNIENRKLRETLAELEKTAAEQLPPKAAVLPDKNQCADLARNEIKYIANKCVDMFRTVAHEIGHVLGFGHSDDIENSLMASGYNGAALTETEIETARTRAGAW